MIDLNNVVIEASCVARAGRSIGTWANFFVLIKFRLALDVLAQDVAFEPDGHFAKLIGSVSAGRDGEH
jgi:hypothetical protein